MDRREADEFRRIRVLDLVDRAERLIEDYRDNIQFYRRRIDRYHVIAGHIAERMGDIEPEEP
jgi:hypothetical protein